MYVGDFFPAFYGTRQQGYTYRYLRVEADTYGDYFYRRYNVLYRHINDAKFTFLHTARAIDLLTTPAERTIQCLQLYIYIYI